MLINFFKHLKTVHIHRRAVRKMCFKMGIPWLGLTHDLSKYSITELKICKYYVGTRSPHQVAREELGYSPSWIHHYHINRHHWQYWLDDDENTGGFVAIKMPYKYVIESLCDMVGAGKAYMKKNWDCTQPWKYWQAKCEGKRLMHDDSIYLLKKLLWMLAVYGENKFIERYRYMKDYLKDAYEKGTLKSQDDITAMGEFL